MKRCLSIVIVGFSIISFLSACTTTINQSNFKDTYTSTQEYIGMDYSEVEAILSEDNTATFLGYDGIIKTTEENGIVDIVAFESTDMQSLKYSDLESLLTENFGSYIYIDNDSDYGYSLHYYELNDDCFYLVVQYDYYTDYFTRFMITHFNEKLTSNTVTESNNAITSEYQAISEAESYVSNNAQKVINKASPQYGLYDYKLFEVASSEVESRPYDDDEYSHYSILVKGNFSAYDEYGNWSGSYNYETLILVYTRDGDIDINYTRLTKKY